MRSLKFNLSRGGLALEITKELEPFENLVSISERINPKRSFMFVSKVIGRYVPTSLATMLDVSFKLASQVPLYLLKGNTSVVSLSETALGLGALVQSYYTSVGIKSLNVFTSRHMFRADILSSFEEPHSHLPSHFIYKSPDEDINQYFKDTETLVLVDDEITTGNTLRNLYLSLGLTKVKRVILLSLTDWSPPQDYGDVDVHSFSLIKGSYKWTPNSEKVFQLPYDPKPQDCSLLQLENNTLRLPSFKSLPLNPFSEINFTKVSSNNDLIIYVHELLPKALHECLKGDLVNPSEVYFLSISSSPLALDLNILTKKELPGLYSSVPSYLYNYENAVETLNPNISLVTESLHVYPKSKRHFFTEYNLYVNSQQTVTFEKPLGTTNEKLSLLF